MGRWELRPFAEGAAGFSEAQQGPSHSVPVPLRREAKKESDADVGLPDYGQANKPEEGSNRQERSEQAKADWTSQRRALKVALVEAGGGSSEADQALADVEQRHLCLETKLENEDDDGQPNILAGKEWMAINEGEDDPPEAAELVGSCRIFTWKAEGTPSQGCEPAKISASQERAEGQPGTHPEAEVGKLPSCETTVQAGLHA
ncbi:hypothetical protein lerEdw1_015823, partial [Lerista edwardsae]